MVDSEDQQQDFEQDDVLELEEGDQAQDQDQDEADQEAGEANELTIEIEGYDPEPAEETPLLKKLRNEIRERDREIAKYRAAQVQTAPTPIEVGEKPTLEGCEWDEDRFVSELEAWNSRKQQAEDQRREQERAAAVEAEKWNGHYQAYRQHAQALNAPDYDAVEKAVAEQLPMPIQNAIPLYFGDKGPQVVLALGRKPALLNEIVRMTDPVAQLLRLKEIAMGVKINMQRKPPAPERETIQTGTASTATTSDKELEKLEKQAERTGDRTALLNYKRQMKAA